MWQYYILLGVAVVLFSIQFVFSKLYQKQRGNSFFVAMMSNVIVCVGMIPFYFILNGGKLEVTSFSLLMAFAFALCGILCNFAGLKVLAVANLSVYSMFLMLGGMLIPLIYGFFVGEKMTLLKAVAIVLVIAALALTLKKDEKAKEKSNYAIVGYILIFLMNGLVGVCTFAHQKSQFDTVSASGFLLLAAIVRLVVSLVMILINAIHNRNKKTEEQTTEITEEQTAEKTETQTEEKAVVDKNANVKSWLISIAVMLGYAAVNGTAQLLSTHTAAYVEAGVQSTIVTGGCIFLSAVLGLLFHEKITKKTIFSLLLALAGVVLIML